MMSSRGLVVSTLVPNKTLHRFKKNSIVYTIRGVTFLCRFELWHVKISLKFKRAQITRSSESAEAGEFFFVRFLITVILSFRKQSKENKNSILDFFWLHFLTFFFFLSSFFPSNQSLSKFLLLIRLINGIRYVPRSELSQLVSKNDWDNPRINKFH